nr:helix-turn-helix domain-containing protein [Enterococcus rivorum]
MTIDEQNFSFCLDDGRTIYLTRLEYRLFVELAKEPNQTVLYADLIERIWSETVQKDTIYRLANLVFHVRQKLRKEQINPEIIKTIRSRGYMLYE